MFNALFQLVLSTEVVIQVFLVRSEFVREADKFIFLKINNIGFFDSFFRNLAVN